MAAQALKHFAAGCCALLVFSSAYAERPNRQFDPASTETSQRQVSISALPAEAQTTLNRIDQGGPFPYDKDGVVFGNYERQLPKQRRGYYREYTVPTPGARNRGARRIIVGGKPPYGAEYFYTSDHYASFVRIQKNASQN